MPVLQGVTNERGEAVLPVRILILALAGILLTALVFAPILAKPPGITHGEGSLPGKKLQLKIGPAPGIPVSQQLLLQVLNVGEYDFRFLPCLQATRGTYPGVFIELLLARKGTGFSTIQASKVVLERIDQPAPDFHSFETLRPNEHWQQPLSAMIWAYAEHLEKGQEGTIKARVEFGQCEWLLRAEPRLDAAPTPKNEGNRHDCPAIESDPMVFVP